MSVTRRRNVCRSLTRSRRCATILVRRGKAFSRHGSRITRCRQGSRRSASVARARRMGPITFIIIAIITSTTIKVRHSRARALSLRSKARTSLPSTPPSNRALNAPAVARRPEVGTVVWVFVQNTTQSQHPQAGRLTNLVIHYLRIKAPLTRNRRIIPRTRGFKARNRAEKTASIVNLRN